MSTWYCKHGQPAGGPCDECAAKQEGVSFAPAPGSAEQRLKNALEVASTRVGMNLNMEAEALETRNYELAAACRTRAQTYQSILALLR